MLNLPHRSQTGMLWALLGAAALLTIGCAKPGAETTAERRWTNHVNMTFVQIPAGVFAMGSPPSETLRFDNETAHQVRIDRAFHMSATHVTVAQFKRFIDATGYRTAAEREGWAYGAWNTTTNAWDRHEGASWRNVAFEQTPDHPVVNVNWHDAIEFCKWLSETEGRRYRLPTEAEWEYACRAGSQAAYFWGDDPNAGQGFANCLDETSKQTFTLFPPFEWSDGYLHTSPAGAFKPNAFGLHDMLGNALQWCGDWFAPYPTEDVTNPTGPADGQQRILRGGAFLYGPKHSRCAFRGRNDPEFRNFYISFRVVCEAQ